MRRNQPMNSTDAIHRIGKAPKGYNVRNKKLPKKHVDLKHEVFINLHYLSGDEYQKELNKLR